MENTVQSGVAIADIPAALQASSDDSLVLSVTAEGHQVYVCKFDEATQAHIWEFKAPVAEISGIQIDISGTHYKGPTWALPDGSKVVGKLKTSDPVAGLGAGSIPWLLLDVTENSGEGLLSKVTKIQRVDTTGGRKPDGMTDAKYLGMELYVYYTATYHFYAPAETY